MSDEVKSTTNYKQFQTYDFNRNLDQKHVNKLRREISSNNLLSLNPILVSKDNRIIDGQHRWAAVKSLSEDGQELDLFFVVVDSEKQINGETLASIQRFQKTWSLHDYLKLYVYEGREHYIKFQNFIGDVNSYEGSIMFDIQRLFVLTHFGSQSAANSRGSEVFKAGGYRFEHEPFARKMIELLREYWDTDATHNVSTRRNFQSAVIWTICKNFLTVNDHYEEIDRLNKSLTRFIFLGNGTREFLTSLQEMRNYHRKIKVELASKFRS